MAKEVVPNPELRKIGLEFYKGPFRFDHLGGYIWAKGDETTHGSQMFADLDQAAERCARIRGWGALQYLKDVDCEALQDEIGVMFAEAITEYWDRAKNTIVHVLTAVTEDQGESFNRLQDWVETQGGAGAKCHVISRVKPGIEMATSHEHCDYFMQVDLPAHGICALLKEGDKITLLQGRVFVEIQPRVIYPEDVPTIKQEGGLLGFTPTEQQN
ncbi:hypothetical protein D3C86_1491860 [compost metagenome]